MPPRTPPHPAARGSAKAALAARLRSLDAIFRPRAIAVVGAGRRRHTIGHEIVRNLVRGGFTGPVYPVNPNATVVHSMHCYARVSAIPGEVDLALLVVPAPLVLEAARDCAEKGVQGLVCITAGFSEIGGEGSARQAALLEVCAEYGMRLIGPNCMGVLNTAEEFCMNASFAKAEPRRGEAAFLSQSGALGAVILNDAESLGLGVSMFASLGNRADVCPTDLLEYWEADPATKQILMYLEAFGEPERFMTVARRVSRKKPILIVKSGRSDRGARAAVSHTGSLAGSEVAVDSLLEQCGVQRVQSMKELFALAGAVQNGKLPAGRRVAIVTNAGGPAILATDACIAEGLVIGDLSPKTRRKLEGFLPPEASTANPVDMIASADARSFDQALKLVLADPGVDMVLAICVAPIMIEAASVAEVFAERARTSDKPLLVCLPGLPDNDAALDVLRRADVPNYSFPEEAARVLSGLFSLRTLRDRPDGSPPDFRVNRKAARVAIEGALAAGRVMLEGQELLQLARAYGLEVVPSQLVSSREEALRAVRKIGFPLVLKAVSKDLLHKSDRGGVLLDLRNREELLQGYDDLEERFLAEHPDLCMMLQAMRSGGVETFFGVASDPLFGRMLAFGLGGIHVEIMKDVVFRLHPLTTASAREMVEAVRGKALFEGARGKPPVDKQELCEVLLRLSQMLSDNHEIVELDLNPFLAGYEGQGSCILDMRVRLGEAREADR
jgi:acetyl coenzyme A synthetase (ADP forming)-like protein